MPELRVRPERPDINEPKRFVNGKLGNVQSARVIRTVGARFQLVGPRCGAGRVPVRRDPCHPLLITPTIRGRLPRADLFKLASVRSTD